MRRFQVQSYSVLAGLLWLYTTGVALTANATSPNVVDTKWAQCLKAGIDALDTNRYWLAEPALKQAVVEAGKFGSSDLRLAKSLGELARLYSVRGKFADAEPLLEEELYIKQQVFSKESDQLVPAMGSMIKFYLGHGTAAKADELTEQMLDIVEGKLREPKSKPKTKMSRVNGEIVLEAWVGTASEAMRNPFIEWAITCDGVGNVYLSQQKFDLAERLFKAALDVKETVLGKTHLSLANSYDSLGGLELARKDYVAAESNYRDSFEMTRKVLPSDNPVVYGRLDKLAKCLIAQGKRQEAATLYLSAQHFWKDEPCKNGDSIRAMYAIGNMYCEDKNFQAAAPILQKALHAAKEFYGTESISLVPYLQRYSYALYYLGEKPQSDEIKSRVAAISRTL